MERCDADQEPTTLRTTNASRLLIRDECNRAILLHMRLCPFTAEQYGARLRSLEMSFSKLIGFMLGSGVLGGVAGSLAHKLFP